MAQMTNPLEKESCDLEAVMSLDGRLVITGLSIVRSQEGAARGTQVDMTCRRCDVARYRLSSQALTKLADDLPTVC